MLSPKTMTEHDFAVAAFWSDRKTAKDSRFVTRRCLIELKLTATSFQLNLFDFGVVVKRSNDELFQLDEKWMQRQPAAYPGKLESVPVETVADLEKRVIKQFVDVKVESKCQLSKNPVSQWSWLINKQSKETFRYSKDLKWTKSCKMNIKLWN